jgi:hypothetical protein
MEVHVNYLSVLVAAIVGGLVGGIWYGALFKQMWIKLSGVPEMKMTPKNVIIGFIGTLFMSYVLFHAIGYGAASMKLTGIQLGFLCGFFNWLGFIAPVTLGMVLYENKSWKLWFLNNAYWLVTLLVMGAILSVWN